MAVLGGTSVPPREDGDLGGDQADDEEQDGGGDVRGAVDLERLVRLGEEEVVGDRGDDRADHPCASSPHRRQYHDHDEHEGDVRVDDGLVPERDENARHHEGTETPERDACALGAGADHAGVLAIVARHTPGIRLLPGEWESTRRQFLARRRQEGV